MNRYKDDSPQTPGDARRTDPFYILMLILIAVVAALTVSVVAFLISSGRTAASSGTESGDSSVESSVSSESVSSELASSSTTSSDLASSGSELSGASSGASSTAGSSGSAHPSSASTEDTAMAAFEENTIDRKKEAALLSAQSTTEILKVYDTTFAEWKTAVAQMMTQLKTYRVDLSQEQTRWLSETDAAIAAKDKTAQAGGSAQQIEAAEYKCQLYRDRARVLFARLAQYNPDYRF